MRFQNIKPVFNPLPRQKEASLIVGNSEVSEDAEIINSLKLFDNRKDFYNDRFGYAPAKFKYDIEKAKSIE
ncbi:MAG: hypothetical protein HUJ51_04060 [Eggerthellaceae bacterium]|nr:hypothetical protein [Eggerthellaceae bacterium]